MKCGPHPASVAEEGKPRGYDGNGKSQAPAESRTGRMRKRFHVSPSKTSGDKDYCYKNFNGSKSLWLQKLFIRRCINCLEASAEKDCTILLKFKLQRPSLPLKKHLHQKLDLVATHGARLRHCMLCAGLVLIICCFSGPKS